MLQFDWTFPVSVDDPIARLRQGDLEGLEKLIPLYEVRLYRYLLRLVRDPAAAQDLFHETWLRAAERIGRYDPSRPFDTWLFSLAHNLAIDFLRRVQPESLDAKPHCPPADSGQIPILDRLIERERRCQVDAAVGGLPAEAREIISLRFEEGMKLEEIAEATGTPLPTVKTRLRRALIRLKEVLNVEPAR